MTNQGRTPKACSLSIGRGPDDDTLMVATRIRDTAFKGVLETMPIGTALKIEGPPGDLTLQNDSARSAIFLARRDRHQVFRSILVQAAQQKTAAGDHHADTVERWPVNASVRPYDDAG